MTNSEKIATVSKSNNRSESIAVDTALNLKNQSLIEHNSQVGFDPERLIPKPTYVEVGIEKITALCNAVGLNEKTSQVIEVFRAMTTSWGDKKVGDISGWMSDVSDDHTPFEFSIAFEDDRSELRILLEAQGNDPDLQSNWQAGLDLNQYLAAHYHVSLDRFGQIEDLFVPTNSEAKFSMWHAVCFYPHKEPAFKLYLNPQSQQKSRAAAVVEESLVRLGFPHAWPNLAEIAAQRGPDKDEFVYFSLDLAVNPKARVKVYLRHHDATAEDLEKALSLADNYVAGDATEFCQAMAAGQTSFSAKPTITCFSLIEGDSSTPSNGTLYLPISNYAPDDRVVCDHLDLYLIQHGLLVSTYQAAIQSLATRPLEAGIGMHSYISLRQEQQQRRVTLYINSEVNAVRPPVKILATQPARSLLSLEKMASHYECQTVAHHPFLARLQREPVNPMLIWLLFMNIREAVVTHFSRRLANIIARIDDERIRCILTKQLNEELGNGDIEHIHRKLFDRLMAEIEPWRMESFTEEMLTPGKKFSQRLEEIYLDSNSYMGVGAAILMEIQGKQFDLCLGKEFRKTNIDLSKISWLTLHEELEIDHADEALVLSRFVANSPEGIAAAKQGIEKTRISSWSFLDDLYRLCFA